MLNTKDIDHIADLARLELTEAEKKQYQEQLSSVLDYIDQLKEVDTESAEITAQVTGLKNVYRQDEAIDWDEAERQAALDQAPAREGESLKVKRVLEHAE